MTLLYGVLVLLASVIIAVVGTSAAIAAMRRDRHRHGGSGSMGAAMQEIEGLFVQSKKHVIEAQRHEAGEEDEGAGDPPQK